MLPAARFRQISLKLTFCGLFAKSVNILPKVSRARGHSSPAVSDGRQIAGTRLSAVRRKMGLLIILKLQIIPTDSQVTIFYCYCFPEVYCLLTPQLPVVSNTIKSFKYLPSTPADFKSSELFLIPTFYDACSGPPPPQRPVSVCILKIYLLLHLLLDPSCQ